MVVITVQQALDHPVQHVSDQFRIQAGSRDLAFSACWFLL